MTDLLILISFILLRNIAPREGTEIDLLIYWLEIFQLRNIAPREGTETVVVPTDDLKI